MTAKVRPLTEMKISLQVHIIGTLSKNKLSYNILNGAWPELVRIGKVYTKFYLYMYQQICYT